MSQSTNEMTDEEFEANHKKEANKILQELNEAGFEISFIKDDFYIHCKNPDYQPDNGSTPYLACLLRHIEQAVWRKNNK